MVYYDNNYTLIKNNTNKKIIDEFIYNTKDNRIKKVLINSKNILMAKYNEIQKQGELLLGYLENNLVVYKYSVIFTKKQYSILKIKYIEHDGKNFIILVYNPYNSICIKIAKFEQNKIIFINDEINVVNNIDDFDISILNDEIIIVTLNKQTKNKTKRIDIINITSII